MVRKIRSNKKHKSPSQSRPTIVLNGKTENESDYYSVFQKKIEELLKNHPTAVVSYFKKTDVIRVLKTIASTYQPSPDDPDLSLFAQVGVGSLLYELGNLLTFSESELRELLGNEVYDELHVPEEITILSPVEVPLG